jgi:hypothetical protein
VYTVTEAEGEILGACEFRRRSDRVFLNYIAVGEHSRGRGVARALLTQSLRLFIDAVSPDATFSLDVFTHNLIAREWYGRLGLRPVEAYEWYRIADPGALDRLSPGPASPYYVTGIAQADIVHKHLGFSEFSVETPEGHVYSVGRLGAKWFRLTSADGSIDPGLIALLRELDPARGLFFIARPPQDNRKWPSILTGQRIEGRLRVVLCRLDSADA